MFCDAAELFFEVRRAPDKIECPRFAIEICAVNDGFRTGEIAASVEGKEREGEFMFGIQCVHLRQRPLPTGLSKICPTLNNRVVSEKTFFRQHAAVFSKRDIPFHRSFR